MYPYGALTSCKKLEKTNERSLRYLKTDGPTDHGQGRLLRTPLGKPRVQETCDRIWENRKFKYSSLTQDLLIKKSASIFNWNICMTSTHILKLFIAPFSAGYITNDQVSNKNTCPYIYPHWSLGKYYKPRR